MNIYGTDALLRIAIHLACIYFAYWALNAIRLDVFFKKDHEGHVKVILVMMAIFLGYQTSTFILEVVSLLKNYILTYIS